MSNLLKSLRIAADPTRLRILLLLQGEGLSVAELQEILTMGQSTISTHLAQLKQAGLAEDRRVGKSSLYQLTDTAAKSPFTEILARAKDEIAEAPTDLSAMRRVLRKRQDKMRAFFDSVAGRLGKDYVPGKSWKSVADALLHLLPPLIIADLGSGEGGFALLLAQTAKRVIAVDSSEKMLEVGRGLAQRNSVRNVEFRQGDMEELPIDSASVDAVFFSQSLHHALHPDGALTEAHRILVPGGRVVILDLAKHRFEEARELYADEWLGFSEAELESMLQGGGFTRIHTAIVDKEAEPPNFQTVLAVAHKTGA